ncbi:MAG: hypothetical protein JOY93_06500 [Acidobacteriales bacterium]|nr:hypothetical protein [Terriglobales bacterium]
MLHAITKSSVLAQLVFLLPASAMACFGQMPAQPSSVDTLRQLTLKSGYIFSGSVTAVQRVAPLAQNDLPTMQVTFRVEEAFAGVRHGQPLIIREWAGLWGQGERYRVGEHLVLFLYRPSKLGLTSPVGGELGRFRIDPEGFVALHPQRTVSFWEPPMQTAMRGKSRIRGPDFWRAIRRAREE